MSKYTATVSQRIGKDRIDFEFLRNKLKVKNLEVKNSLETKHSHVTKFLRQKGVEIGRLRDYSAKLLSTGILSSALLLSVPAPTKGLPAPSEIVQKVIGAKDLGSLEPSQAILTQTLRSVLPQIPRSLSVTEETFLEQIYQSIIGVKIKANLEGEHLNTTYGLIGAEQHLYRYPGDRLENHGNGQVLKEGIAPGLGAWGHFARSENALTPDLVETEKWYAVVQTLYLPDWNTRFRYLRDWYKYRKVLIVNTINGNTVVAAIADSGPAAWTGKHFGGSPEVMDYLGGSRYKKGPVTVFFVDDPDNKVPLGPVEYNEINLTTNYQLSIISV